MTTSSYLEVRGRSPVAYPPLYDPYQGADQRVTGGAESPTHSAFRSRTPSPTPSERNAIEDTHLNFFQKFARWPIKNKIIYLAIMSFVIGFTVVTYVFRTRIVNALAPETDWLKTTPEAWLIPIAILIIMSFPPLFGQEIVAAFCGLTWGVGIGIGIVAAGTLIGEIINYFVFKYSCRARSERLEQKNIQYACLSRVIREGGLATALIIRYSVLPSHFITTVFATCGLNVVPFLISAILSLPKYCVQVYLGLGLLESGNKTQTIVQTVVTIVFVITTIVAMHYTKAKIRKVMPTVIYERRKARQAKLYGTGVSNSFVSITSETEERQPLKNTGLPPARVEVSAV